MKMHWTGFSVGLKKSALVTLFLTAIWQVAQPQPSPNLSVPMHRTQSGMLAIPAPGTGALRERYNGRRSATPHVIGSATLDASSIFVEALEYDSGGLGTFSVAAADVNGDGKPDLVVASECSYTDCIQGTVSVLLGNGDGTFQPAVTYSSGGYYATAVAVADLNGDGKPDLVVSNWCPSSGCTSAGVSVLMGNGDGTFQPAVSYIAGTGRALSVAVGDMNGDGIPDLIVGTEEQVSVLLGNGDGTFQPWVGYGLDGSSAQSVAVADVNRDGKPDILFACDLSDGANLGVLLGNGDGTFQKELTYGAGGYGASSLAVADVNGDGMLDVIVGSTCDTYTLDNCDNGVVGVLLGNGDGSFLPAMDHNSGGLNATALAIADVNGDYKPDLVVVNQCGRIGGYCYSDEGDASTVSIFLGNGDGTFQPYLDYLTAGSGGVSLAIADVNADGKPDLLVANQCAAPSDCGTSSVSVLLASGNGAFQAGADYASGGFYQYSVAAADVNADGNLDLLVANRCVDRACNTSSVGVLLGNGDGTFQSAVSYSPSGSGLSAVSAADVNGDGKLDLLLVNECGDSACNTGSVEVWLGNGDGTFQSGVSYSSGAAYSSSVMAADLNGDGKLDLVIGSLCSHKNPSCLLGRVSVLIGNADGTFQPAVTYSSGGDYAALVIAADVNADGKLDLLVVNECADTACNAGSVGVLLGNGDGTFQNSINYNSGGRYSDGIALADVNGDGIPDLLVDNSCDPVNCLAGSLSVLLGNGDGTFQTALAQDIPATTVGGGVAVADFNGDGRLDVVSGHNALLLGGGAGTFVPYRFLGATGEGIVVGDFNRDGQPDLAVALADGSGVTVLLSRPVSQEPGFSLEASPSNLTVAQGEGGMTTITITPWHGFSGSVLLSASGLPAGVTATFNPNPATGSSTLTLAASNSAATGTATVTVTGISGGVTQAVPLKLTVTQVPSFTLSVDPSTLTLLLGGQSTSMITVTHANGFVGSVSLSASGLPSGVTATFNPNPTTYTSTLTLTASDTASVGAATVTLTGVSSGVAQTVPLTLTLALPTTATLSPSSLVFPDQAIHTTSAAKTVTLKNTGKITLNISGISANGDFAVSSNSCGATLAVGKSCKVSVTFTPGQIYSRTGTLSITDNAVGSSQVVPLSGWGVAAASLSPPGMNFQKQAVGTTSAAKNFTITNYQPTPLTGIAISITGDFAISTTTCGTTLPAKAKCIVSVASTPATTGATTGQLWVTASEIATTPLTAWLQGVGIADATLIPANAMFASRAVGTTSPPRKFTLTNHQPGDLTQIAITATGNFAVSGTTCGTNLGPKDKCMIEVTFTPTATGTSTGQLIANYNGTDSPQVSNLSGTGK